MIASSLRFEDLAVDPYPHLARLRSGGGAVWAPKLGMWLVAGYDDAAAVLRDPERFTNDSPKSLIQATFGRQMLSVEGEEQKRHKQACLAPFTGRASREVWQPRIDRLCEEILRAAEARALGPHGRAGGPHSGRWATSTVEAAPAAAPSPPAAGSGAPGRGARDEEEDATLDAGTSPPAAGSGTSGRGARAAAGVAPNGATAGAVDLMADYAAPIALRTMGIVVGLPSADLPRVRGWYDVFARSLANFEGAVEVHRAGQEAATAMRTYLAEKLDGQSRAGETGSGTLIAALAGGAAPLERSEALANLLIVLFGGIETTESMIGNALYYLLSERGLLAAMLESRSNGEAAFAAAVEDVMEESLRYDPAVQTLTRHATTAVRIGDASITAGETVQCMVGGANRDPAVFERPDRFEPGRANVRRHLAFGLGNHFCLGAQLARAETRAALRTLLERWPGVELDRASSLPPYGHEFRKPGRLVARLGQCSAGSLSDLGVAPARPTDCQELAAQDVTV